jgi:hypothetical protein
MNASWRPAAADLPGSRLTRADVEDASGSIALEALGVNGFFQSQPLQAQPQAIPYLLGRQVECILCANFCSTKISAFLP